ncbi:hypothetical protein AAFF_G00413630 [Aldrovandia affinis]|uniref:Uncharacterized protein n=1 Tax=Aldrovandia affinis TaxID=143900 RepID=A0AAD7SB71_9TELE|nr:hypothetical protein AAFF_G00413630 [Aldrovandia affinis]
MLPPPLSQPQPQPHPARRFRKHIVQGSDESRWAGFLCLSRGADRELADAMGKRKRASLRAAPPVPTGNVGVAATLRTPGVKGHACTNNNNPWRYFLGIQTEVWMQSIVYGSAQASWSVAEKRSGS